MRSASFSLAVELAEREAGEGRTEGRKEGKKRRECIRTKTDLAKGIEVKETKKSARKRRKETRE